MSLLLKNLKCKINDNKGILLHPVKQKITVSHAYSVDKRISYVYKIKEI